MADKQAAVPINDELINRNNIAEETALRLLDNLAKLPNVDKRWLEIGRTAIENGFMAVNRAVSMQPGRVRLADDPHEGYKA